MNPSVFHDRTCHRPGANPSRITSVTIVRILPAGRAGPEGHPVSEAEAQTLLTYSAILIPGLLQTEDYARAVIRGMLPELSSEEVERRVIARMDR